MRRGMLRILLLLAALAAAPGLALAFEEQSLLTPDGTMHVVRAGRASDLGITALTPSPDSFAIFWSSRAQDGTLTTSVVPGTVSYQEKRGLQLAFDEPTGKLLLLWIEEVSAYSHVRIGVLQAGVWTNNPLLPQQGLTRAFNPVMRVTHQSVTWLDEKDNAVSATASILSVLWWEDAPSIVARFANVFLDENSTDPSSLAAYDMPGLLGDQGAASYDDVPSGAYLYPSLQTDGFSGAVLASFADLNDKRSKVVRIEFPRDRGKPSEPGNLKWERRHAPILSVAVTGPLARMAPSMEMRTDPVDGVGTSIGERYIPTLYWRDVDSLKFTRLDGEDWSPLRSIALNDQMTYAMARDLVIAMGQRN
jgi:hypothetical protein